MSKALSYKQKIIAARARIKEIAPYFRAAVLGAIYVDMPRGTLGTMGITKDGVLYYDPNFIDACTVDAVAFGILHEVAGHWLRDHNGRRPPGADHTLWNIAGDAEINDDLMKLKLKDTPPGPVLPAMLGCKEGLTAEEYFAKLRDEVAKGAGKPDTKDGCASGHCGSGAGHAHKDEPGGKAKDGTAEDDGVGEGRTEAERARIAARTAEAIKNHVDRHGRGSVPAGFDRWADRMLQPAKIDWRAKLSALVKSAVTFRPGAITTTWTRMGRKQAGLGYGNGCPVTPAWRAPVPNVAVVVDTSGSMGEAELQDAVNETAGILKAVNGAVEFIAIDAAVHSEVVIADPSQISKHLKGGGGTDFRPAFDRLCRNRPGKTRPEVIIFITDGCGPAPETPPVGCKVIWVLVGPYQSRPVEWGEVCAIEHERAAA